MADRAVILGAAIREAVDRSGVEDAEIGHSVFGIVVQAGVGQIPSRQANFHAGLPFGLTTETLNQVCPSERVAMGPGALPGSRESHAPESSRRGKGFDGRRFTLSSPWFSVVAGHGGEVYLVTERRKFAVRAEGAEARTFRSSHPWSSGLPGTRTGEKAGA